PTSSVVNRYGGPRLDHRARRTPPRHYFSGHAAGHDGRIGLREFARSLDRSHVIDTETTQRFAGLIEHWSRGQRVFLLAHAFEERHVLTLDALEGLVVVVRRTRGSTE